MGKIQMKVHSTEKKIREKQIEDLTHEEIDNLTVDDLEYLRKKYQVTHPTPTIIGKGPYEPFLAGIDDDNWMSTGDQVKDD